MSNESEQLTELFKSLGANEETAKTMAIQLLKRSEQIAGERSVTKLEALEYLIRVTLAGRDGRVYDGPPPGNGSDKPKKG